MTRLLKSWPPSSLAFAGFIILVPFESSMGGLRIALLWAAAATWIAELLWARAGDARGGVDGVGGVGEVDGVDGVDDPRGAENAEKEKEKENEKDEGSAEGGSPYQPALAGSPLPPALAGGTAIPSFFKRALARLLDLASAVPRELPWKHALVASVGLFAVCIAIVAVASSGSDRSDYISDLLKRAGPFIIALPLIFFTAQRNSSCPQASALARRVDLAIWIALAAWGAWMLVAACYSIRIDRSLKLFAREGGPFLLACALMRAKMSESGGPLRWLTAHAAVGRTLALAVLSVLVMAYAGPAEWEDYFAHNDWIRGARGPQGERIVRVQWPFAEHNRLASYLLAVALLTPAAWALAAPGRERAKMAASSAVMLGAMLFTGTRGGVIAAGCGLGLFLFVRPRIPLLIALACALIVLFVPSGMPQHLQSIFNPSTYRDPHGNVQSRFRAWDAAFGMIRERPILGMGYGWTNFEAEHKKLRARGLDDEDKPHAHNNFLEVMAETGGVGLALFLAYQAALMAGILLMMRGAAPGSTARAVGWALLGLMAGLHVFGMTNYTLRRTVGFEIWMAWGAVQALACWGMKSNADQDQDQD